MISKTGQSCLHQKSEHVDSAQLSKRRHYDGETFLCTEKNANYMFLVFDERMTTIDCLKKLLFFSFFLGGEGGGG